MQKGPLENTQKQGIGAAVPLLGAMPQVKEEQRIPPHRTIARIMRSFEYRKGTDALMALKASSFRRTAFNMTSDRNNCIRSRAPEAKSPGAWAEVDTNPYWRYVLHSIAPGVLAAQRKASRWPPFERIPGGQSQARPPGLHMELTILDYLGLPEGSILSVRSGPTRRQSPLPCSAPFRLPPGPWPLRIDVLGLLGKSSSHIVLTSGENGLCRLPLEGKDGRPMSVTFQVCTENGPRPKTSPSLSRRLEDAAPVKKRDAEADARAYLDTHRLHEFMHGLFELLLRERPEDPYSFMAKRFRQAAAMEAQSEGAGPGSGLKASRSSVSTAPTSATSLSLSSPTRDSSLAATTLSASFGEVPEGAFKVWVRSMRGRSIAKLVVGPKEKVGSLKQRLPGAAASSQLLWLGEMLPNDSTLEDWFVEPGLVMLNVVSSQKEPRVRHILSGASEGGIRLWNPANAEKVQDMTPLVQSAILAMVACWERMRVLCTTSDGRMQLWDLSEGTCLNSVVAHQDEAGCVAVDWATEQALTGCLVGPAKLWCLKTFRCLNILASETAVDSLSVDWPGRRACAGLRNGAVRLWDLDAAQVLGDFAEGAETAKESGTAVSGTVVDCRGRRALSGFEAPMDTWHIGTSMGEAQLAQSRTRFHRSAKARTAGEESTTEDVSEHWREADSRALVGSDDGSLSLWRVESGECLARFARHIGFVWAIHADWARERAVSGAFDGCLKLWDLRTGECLRTIQGHSRPIRSICCGGDPNGEPRRKEIRPVMNWSSLEQFPAWRQASAPSLPRCTKTDLAAAAAWGEKRAFFLLTSQTAKDEEGEASASSQVSVELFLGNPSSPQSALVNRTIQIGVQGVNVRKAPFSQLLVARGGRGLCLVGACAAAVALPDLEDEEACWDLQAVALSGPSGPSSILKVAWHPLSDCHLGVLGEGSWSLVNLSASVREPELHFDFRRPEKSQEETVVDFAWAIQDGPGATPEEAWLSLSVFFLGSSGRISLRNPVLPSVAVMPQAMLSALAADPNDWLREALLTGPSMAVEHSGGSCVTRHSLHLHARGPRTPGEQMVEEALQDGPQSPQSARHAKSSFCSLQLVSLSPLVMIARATNSGLIQLLALEAAPGPAFTSTKIACALLEEIDLMCSSSEASLRMLALHHEPNPSFLAYSNSLVAVVDINLQGTSSVRTLAETRSEAKESGSTEFAGLQLLDGRGLLLRVERRSSRSPIALQLLDLESKGLPGDKSEGREPSTCKESQGLDSLRRLLLAPLGPGAAERAARSAERSAERSADEVARELSQLQAQLASLCPRQELLQHLGNTLPSRVDRLTTQLAELSEKPGPKLSSEDSELLALGSRQEALLGRQRRVLLALSAELELRALASLSQETPRLFARFHELRRATKLLKTGIQASKESRNAGARFGSPSAQLSLQRGWTGTTAQHLQLQAAEADSVVEAAAAKWP
ncbi:sconB [Symbiodinium microadriaticum]|nr:sconB [Symbiodinium microadriaticum]